VVEEIRAIGYEIDANLIMSKFDFHLLDVLYDIFCDKSSATAVNTEFHLD